MLLFILQIHNSVYVFGIELTFYNIYR